MTSECSSRWTQCHNVVIWNKRKWLRSCRRIFCSEEAFTARRSFLLQILRHLKQSTTKKNRSSVHYPVIVFYLSQREFVFVSGAINCGRTVLRCQAALKKKKGDVWRRRPPPCVQEEIAANEMCWQRGPCKFGWARLRALAAQHEEPFRALCSVKSASR